MTQYSPKYEQNFNVDVIPVPQGWSIRLCRGNGKPDGLLKPGWCGLDDHNLPYKPYMFKTREEAWHFLTNVFWFSKRMDTSKKDPAVRDAQLQALIELNRTPHATQMPSAEAVASTCLCQGCGAGFVNPNPLEPVPYCVSCLQQNETALEGFYHTLFHKTGSAADSLGRVARHLSISKQQAASRLQAIKAKTSQPAQATPPVTQRVASEYTQRSSGITRP